MAKKSYVVTDEGDALRTQVAVVRKYMEDGHRVTQMGCTQMWGFTRLSGIIYILKDDLEREGGRQVVRDEYVSGINRFGNKTHYKEYWIENVS